MMDETTFKILAPQGRDAFIDGLYNKRQDGELSDGDLKNLLAAGIISPLTYDLIWRLPIK